MAQHHNEHLRKIPLFADFDDNELDAIAGVATDVSFHPGTVIMREGAMAHEMVVVREGTLKVTREGEHIADIGPGGLAGELALITHRRRSATVEAATEVKAIHIDGRAFSGLLESAPHMALKMLPIVAGRVADSSERRRD